jgi:hypothetical protein
MLVMGMAKTYCPSQRSKESVGVALSSSRREMDELTLKAAVLEAKNVAAAALLLEA